MFQMLGVFAEFERSIIVSRVKQGMERARTIGTKSGKAIGRPMIRDCRADQIRASLAGGCGIIKTAKLVGCGVGTVQRIKMEMQMDRVEVLNPNFL
jgi:DNA invertase Pin-like site-specific DNA recombinase